MKLERLEGISWQAYVEGRKAPLTRPAGPGYADPAYALSVEWLATRQAIDPAQLAWGNPTTRSRVLLVCGSARNDGACPGEISKAGRLTELAERGRAFSVVVHGDVAGAEDHRRNLCDWLEWMDLIDAGAAAKLDRCIGHHEPYYNRQDALNKDTAIQEEVRYVARSVVCAVEERRADRLSQSDKQAKPPQPK